MPGLGPPSPVPPPDERSPPAVERLAGPNATAGAPALALRPREAAKALGIGQRLLWSMTNQRRIPHLRIGKAVVYPVAELQRWLTEEASKAAHS